MCPHRPMQCNVLCLFSAWLICISHGPILYYPILECSFKFDWVEKSAVEGGGGVIRNMRADVMQNNAMLRCWDAMCQDCNWVVSSYKSDLASIFIRCQVRWISSSPEWWLWWRVTMLDNDTDKGDKCRLTGLHNEIASQMNISLPAHCALRWDHRDTDLLNQMW